MKKTDIAIVGGGLAGLYLAYLLEKKGLDYQLFEAKERLGGRILSEPINGAGALGVDLGPTWFWPHQYKIQQLLRDLDVASYQQYVDGDALYQMQQGLPPQRTAGAGSLLSYRIVGGMGSLIDTLAESTNKINMSQAITGLEKNADGWLLQSQVNGSEVFHAAKQLIVAVPPRIAENISGLDQYLPSELQKQFSNTPTWMAAQAKFVAVYDSPFWREEGLAGDAFSRVGPMVEIHDASADVDRAYALFGFLGLPAKSRENFPEEALSQLCIKQLGDLFGEQALQPQQAYLKDWAKDQWLTTIDDINDMPEHPHMSLQPYEQILKGSQLGFVGTEYAESEAGYVEGALISAETMFNDMNKNFR